MEDAVELEDAEPIRVVVRVRPIAAARGTVSVHAPDTIHVRRKEGELRAQFDAVLDTAAAQRDVYTQVAPAVQAALNGLNSTVFAYGQTGSGKTHTLFGGMLADEEGDEASEGMAARALRAVFAQAEAMRATGSQLAISCSFLEVYNEAMTDLLLPPAARQAGVALRCAERAV
jgi:DNA-binding FrmR family transcriptional regulator